MTHSGRYSCFRLHERDFAVSLGRVPILQVPSYEQLTVALDTLDISAMLARLPKNLISVNREALYIVRDMIASVAAEEPPPERRRQRARAPRAQRRRSQCLGSGPDNAPSRDLETVGASGDLAVAADYIAGETLQLLSDATWHPALSGPYRWWRTRQLAHVMDIRSRPGPRYRDRRRWEREAIRKAKREKQKK